MSSAPLAQSELYDSRPVLVVSMTWAGREWRIAAEDVQILADDGSAVAVIACAAELDSYVEQIGSFGDVTPPETSISFAFVLPDTGVDLLIRRGYDLNTATCDVSMVWTRKGDRDEMHAVHTWERRHKLINGYLSGAVWGDPERPPGYVAATIKRTPWRDLSPVITAEMQVTGDTWPSRSDDADGTSYPLVFGRPGAYAAAGLSYASHIAPGPVVETTGANADTVLVAGHRVLASQVSLKDSAGAVEVFSVDNTQTDGLGRAVATVDVTGAGTISRLDSSYAVAWNGGRGYPLPNDRAASVAAELYALAGADVDVAAWRALSNVVDVVVAGFVDDDGPTVDELVNEHLLPLMPITTMMSPNGVRPVLLDPRRGPETIAGVIREGQGWHRVTGYKAEPERQGYVNTGAVTWGLDNSGAPDKQTTETTIGVADADAAGNLTIQTYPLRALWSRQRYGDRRQDTSFAWVWNKTSAYQGRRWHLERDALPNHVAEWACSPESAHYRAGQWLQVELENGFTDYVYISRRSAPSERSAWWRYLLVRPILPEWMQRST